MCCITKIIRLIKAKKFKACKDQDYTLAMQLREVELFFKSIN